MKKKIFIYTIIFNLIVFCTLYVLLFQYQLGSKPSKSERWIDHLYKIKDVKAKKIKGRKIIVIGGSNTIFGINSEKLSNITNLPVLNLGAHASLDIDFFYYKIKKYIGTNDIVVMPLEYGTYKREGYSNWFINNIMIWGVDYYYSLNSIDKIKFISNVDPKLVLSGVSAKINDKVYKRPNNIYGNLKKLIKKDGVNFRGYRYKSSNLDGEFSVDEYFRVRTFLPYIKKRDSELSNHFLDTYSKIKDLVKEHNAKLILTHPVTFRVIDYNLDNVKEFTQKLSKNYNINIECNPLLFNLDKIYSFDTKNHTNKYGALIRSENLGYCINRLLDNKNYSILSDDEAISQTHKLEMKYASIVKKTPSEMQDLLEIVNALKKYNKKNRSYPISKDFSGVYSLNKTSELSSWMMDLVPKYIPSLVDNSKFLGNSMKYLYKSDGKDYKLIVQKPDNCEYIKENTSGWIDPVRGCDAAGFWTGRAKKW